MDGRVAGCLSLAPAGPPRHTRGMGQERADYEDRDVPVPAVESPAALLWLFIKTVGIAALCVSVLLALFLGAAALVGWLLV